MTYMVIRHYKLHPSIVLLRGLSYDDARFHCTQVVCGAMMQHEGLTHGSAPESSSRSCRLRENREHTKEKGEWFDAWALESPENLAKVGLLPEKPTRVRRMVVLTDPSKVRALLGAMLVRRSFPKRKESTPRT